MTKEQEEKIPTRRSIRIAGKDAPISTTKAAVSKKKTTKSKSAAASKPKKSTKTTKKEEAPVEQDTVMEEVAESEDVGETEEAQKEVSNGPLNEGDIIPDIELTTDLGEKIRLHDIVAENGAVFFCYPKANTGGCTKQACLYRDQYEQWVKTGYQVYGLNGDKPKALSNWKKKNNFQYTLLSDPEGKFLRPLGVKHGSSTARSHFIVGKGGVVQQMTKSVKPGDSSPDALEFVKGIMEESSQ